MAKKIKVKTDPEKGSKRVYRDAADKANQAKREGSNSDFQRALRRAEANGKKTFKWTDPKTGKTGSFAARTNPPSGPDTKKATYSPSSQAPSGPSIKVKRKKPAGATNRANPGRAHKYKGAYKAHNKLRRDKKRGK